MSDPEPDPNLLEGLAIEVVKYAVSKYLHDAEMWQLLDDAPSYLGISELSDEDWDMVHDLVDAAITEVEVYWP